jgi:hypothetical protein
VGSFVCIEFEIIIEKILDLLIAAIVSRSNFVVGPSSISRYQYSLINDIIFFKWCLCIIKENEQIVRNMRRKGTNRDLVNCPLSGTLRYHVQFICVFIMTLIFFIRKGSS